MDMSTVVCPHCGAPLPRQARWRAVSCDYCGGLVPGATRLVQARRFREAFERAAAHGDDDGGGDIHICAGQRYRVIAPLARGQHARVLLAARIGALSERVVLKVADDSAPAGRLQHEHEVLTQLQDGAPAGAAYFTQRLPQPVAFCRGATPAGQPRDMLVLRHPAGFWGSLAAARANYPGGIDARHMVWMWRRVLDVLAYVHAAGWSHGAIHPGHLLVQPRDHGILIVGWAGAVCGGSDHVAACARDLRQAAWSMRALLGADSGDQPPAIPANLAPPLAALLRRASEDAAWCAAQGAAGIDTSLRAAAAAAFGAPRFLVFSPVPPF